jgi:pilus assembly protein CpaB
MKPKTLILLAVAVGCGLVAMLGIQQAMQGGQAGGTPKVTVLVAKADIMPGQPLTEEVVGFEEVPKDAAPEDAVTAPEQYAERALTFGVVSGDIIRQSKLGNPGEFTRSNLIPSGMRAISIAVNDTHTLSGMLRPGDRIDLLVTFQVRNIRGVMTTKTKTLLEYVEVFATDNRTVSDGATKQQENKTKIVSLLVTPEQVSYIKLAESKGQLALSWRHPDDNEEVAVHDIDSELLVELEGLVPSDVDQDRAGPRGPALYASDVAKEPGQDATDPASFLDAAEGEQAPVAATKPDVKERPKWTVRIYEGNESQQTEFELPADSEPAATSPGADGASSNNTQASLTDAFRWLHQTFTQGQLSSTKL